MTSLESGHETIYGVFSSKQKCSFIGKDWEKRNKSWMIQEVFFRLHLATTFANKCVRVIDQVKVIKQSFYWISCGFCTFYIQHIYDHHAEKSLHLFLVNNPGMAMPFAMLLWSPDFRDRTALCNDFSQLFNIFSPLFSLRSWSLIAHWSLTWKLHLKSGLLRFFL